MRAVAHSCPLWLREQQEDLVQVALLRVMNLDKSDEEKRDLPASYLYRVAYSAVVDEIRRIQVRKESPLPDPEEDHVATPLRSLQAGPERHALGRDLGGAILACLRRLLPPRKRAVTLHLQGHRLRETAELMGWRQKQAENLVYRGLAELRACLREKGHQP